MANKSTYNVGVFGNNNLFLGSADGQPFLFIRNSALTTAGIVEYIPSDAVRSAMAMQTAVVSSYLDLNACDNTLAPTYTAAPTTGNHNRTVIMSNLVDSQTETYYNQPFYSLKGDGVLDYTGSDFGNALVAGTGTMSSLMSAATATDTTVTSPTGIAVVDSVIAFIESNIIWILVGLVALDYLGIFAPLNLFGNKKKKAKK